MGEMERLAYDDLWSDSNAMVMGVDCLWGPVLSPHTPSHVTPCVPGSPMEVAVEVHMKEPELDDL